ncbi:MAG: hypothetical protein WCA30_00550 [Dermatophilaceae bacterium]
MGGPVAEAAQEDARDPVGRAPRRRLEHDAHRSTASSKIVRADLATFIVDVIDDGSYVRQAPFVATAR